MNKIKEFISPEVEFADDPMMCELHQIGLKMYEETKNMSDKEWIEYIRQRIVRPRNGSLEPHGIT